MVVAHQRSMRKILTEATVYSGPFVREQWDLTDTNRDGLIQYNELQALLRRLNCRSEPHYAQELYNLSRLRKEDALDQSGLTFDEFRIMLQRLMGHSEIISYFEEYSTDGLMSWEEYKRFLLEVDGCGEAEIRDYEVLWLRLNAPFVVDGKLTDLGFNALITDSTNSLFDPYKSQTYQDMERPLTDYFVASSHNTYLTSDQWVGRSAVGQYIEVLLSGCRCVELDCWDGPDGEPIIFHGHTLTSKIPFEAVVKACRDYGFRVNPYPIILSLEMHCSPRQKVKIGRILTSILQDSLYISNDYDLIQAPSPSFLKYKFLVKGKVLNVGGTGEEEEGNEDELKEEEMMLREQLLEEYPNAYCVDIELPILQMPTKKQNTDSGLLCSVASGTLVLTEYYNVISLEGKKLKSYEDKTRHAMNVATLNERRLMKLMKTESLKLVEFHRRCLSRVFPAGRRVMSSNYNPIPCWMLGIQMVALNYQAVESALLLNYGKFAENGNIGYVLKPDILRHNLDPMFPPSIETLIEYGEKPLSLEVRVLSGQQMPWTKRRNESEGPKLSALYVSVGVYGVPLDQCVKKTQIVMNSGLNPTWSAPSMSFTIHVPSLALLLFEVRQADTVRSELVAGNALPINCIRPGLRWVPLMNRRARMIKWSGLIVTLTKKELQIQKTFT